MLNLPRNLVILLSLLSTAAGQIIEDGVNATANDTVPVDGNMTTAPNMTTPNMTTGVILPNTTEVPPPPPDCTTLQADIQACYMARGCDLNCLLQSAGPFLQNASEYENPDDAVCGGYRAGFCCCPTCGDTKAAYADCSAVEDFFTATTCNAPVCEPMTNVTTGNETTSDSSPCDPLQAEVTACYTQNECDITCLASAVTDAQQQQVANNGTLDDFVCNAYSGSFCCCSVCADAKLAFAECNSPDVQATCPLPSCDEDAEPPVSEPATDAPVASPEEQEPADDDDDDEPEAQDTSSAIMMSVSCVVAAIVSFFL